VDSKTRKQLKTDRFAEELGNSFSWVDEHKDTVKRYGPIVLGVVVVALGIYFYIRYQANVRQEAYAHAYLIDTANVGPAPDKPGGLSYPTEAAKDEARSKAFAELAAKYSGTQEGAIGQMYMAADAADKGNLANAEKLYASVVDSAPKAIAAQARLALADVYSAEGKTADAEKALRYAVANPTITVSKDEATVRLAQFLIKDHCDEARKMLMPLRTGQSATISQAAVAALGQTAACGN
jgi:predicted negative regulator of RcsB-dependent stress response